jgi:glucose/arabinose dehydrogenase
VRAVVSSAPPTTVLDGVRIERAFSASFDYPLFVTHAPGEPDHVYVVTQPGLIYRLSLHTPGQDPEVFLDLRERTRMGGEEGLLGLAFDPDYATSGHYFLYYSPKGDPRRTTLLRRHRANADERVLLEIAQPYSNHNGGWIGFGPDRMLYVGVGDGGSGNDPGNRAQNLGELLGKILRLTRDGAPAPGNPFWDRPGARPEIWAYGLRNPWRNSFDRASGELWSGDVGQNEIEEIDLVTRGGNYGWRLFEGDKDQVNPDALPARDFVRPVVTYDHRYGCSVIGGYVYRGTALPALQGKYFYTDFCSGSLWMLMRLPSGKPQVVQIGTIPTPTSFGEDAAGELYITSFDGHIYRVSPTRPP